MSNNESSGEAGIRKRGPRGLRREKTADAWTSSARDLAWTSPRREGRHRLPVGPVQSRLQRFPGGALLVGLHKGIVETISSIPLPAQWPMQVLVRACRDAPTKQTRAIEFTKMTETIAFMSLAHAQGVAHHGARATHYAELFLTHPSLFTGLAALAEGLVSTTYGAAAYTQVSIGLATAQHTLGSWADEAPLTTIPKDRYPISVGRTVAGFGILAAATGITRELGYAADSGSLRGLDLSPF